MSKQYDLVIKSINMGNGDKALTDNLLVGFLHVLSESEHLPKHIICYGEGVKMLSRSSVSLDDLKAMEEKGVEILACGTCINYYELGEEMAVGKISNMVEIANLLTESEKLVEP